MHASVSSQYESGCQVKLKLSKKNKQWKLCLKVYSALILLLTTSMLKVVIVTAVKLSRIVISIIVQLFRPLKPKVEVTFT